MIHSALMKTGFAAELPNLKGRKFEFTPGINILFGPNGCGKTTILKVCAGHTGIGTSDKMFSGGWSRPPRFQYGDKHDFPLDFSKNTIGNVVAEVEWDGQHCFYNSAGLSESTTSLGHFVSDYEDSPDGMMDMAEQVGLITGHLSEGELRLYKIKRLLETLKKPPNMLPTGKDTRGEAYYKYVKRIYQHASKPTLLWDEPDRSLNVDNQVAFWTRFVYGLCDTEGYQVIIATHSFIPLLIPLPPNKVNLIDVEKGYHGSNRALLLALVLEGIKLQGEKEKGKEPPAKKKRTRKAKSDENPPVDSPS